MRTAGYCRRRALKLDDMVTFELELLGRPAKGRTSVLIGDDNESFRSSLAEYLADQGFEVREAGDGAEVLAVAREHRPQLLLLDVRMPALSGLEAYQRLVKEIGRRLPAIFMTTGPTPEIRRQAQQLGAAALLDKVQLQLSQLQRLVAALLEGTMQQAEAQELIELLLDPSWALDLIDNAQALASAAAVWMPQQPSSQRRRPEETPRQNKPSTSSSDPADEKPQHADEKEDEESSPPPRRSEDF